jgi:hypothetical protein
MARALVIVGVLLKYAMYAVAVAGAVVGVVMVLLDIGGPQSIGVWRYSFTGVHAGIIIFLMSTLVILALLRIKPATIPPKHKIGDPGWVTPLKTRRPHIDPDGPIEAPLSDRQKKHKSSFK